MDRHRDDTLVEQLLRTLTNQNRDVVDQLKSMASQQEAASARQEVQIEKLFHVLTSGYSKQMHLSPRGEGLNDSSGKPNEDDGGKQSRMATPRSWSRRQTLRKPDGARTSSRRRSTMRALPSASSSLSSELELHAIVPAKQQKSSSSIGFDFRQSGMVNFFGPVPSVSPASRSRNTPFQRFVRSDTFNVIGMFPILVFCILLAIETDYMARHGSESHSLFATCHAVLNLWFAIELGVRIGCLRYEFFTTDERMYNILDTIMVLSSFLDVVIIVWPAMASNKGSLSSASMVRTAKIVRALRLGKMLRLARVVGSIAELQKMIFSLQACGMTLFWCVLLMFGFIQFFAILFTQAVVDYGETNPELSFDDGKYAFLLESYGNLLLSTLSLYAAMANGTSWEEMVKPLLALHWIYALVFIFFITFAIFGLLNVITSVFVESTVQTAMHNQEIVVMESNWRKETAIRQLTALFMRMSEDGSGTITIDTMKQFLEEDSDGAGYLEACDIGTTDVEKLFDLLDCDGSGSVSADEFCKGCLRFKGEAKSFDIHCLMHQINRFLTRWTSLSARLDNTLNFQETGVLSFQRFVAETAHQAALFNKTVESVQAAADGVASLMQGSSDTCKGLRQSDSGGDCYDQSKAQRGMDALSPLTLSDHDLDIPNELPPIGLDSPCIFSHAGAQRQRLKCEPFKADCAARR